MVSPIFGEAGTSIFEAMSRLSVERGAINLGQGFPEGFEPTELLDAAALALRETSQQYPPMMGLPVLRQAVAENTRRFLGLDIDWEKEVLVTSGATEALADTFLGHLNTGDEVILFEPAYDAYATLIRRAGGTVVPVRLKPPLWELPREELAKVISPRTRLIVVNTPMNPVGKIFDLDELEFLADLAIKHDLLIVSDEVYEHLVFDERPFHSLWGVEKYVTVWCVSALLEKLFPDGLEGWLCDRFRGDSCANCPCASVCNFYHAPGFANGSGGRVKLAGQLFHRPSCGAGIAERPSGRRAEICGVRGRRCTSHLFCCGGHTST